MSINSRAKGARFERQVAEYLRGHGYEARRGQQYSGSPDSPDVVSNFPLHIEAKAVEKLNLEKAYEQAVKDGGEKPPCVIHKKNRKPLMITLQLDDFIKLIRTTKDPPSV